VPAFHPKALPPTQNRAPVQRRAGTAALFILSLFRCEGHGKPLLPKAIVGLTQ